MSETIFKHTGTFNPSGGKCVVVCNKIPGKEDHALIVETHALPNRIHDAIMGILNSSEGQQATDFGEVLDRRLLPDTGRTILRELMFRNYLRPVPHKDVTIFYRPNEGINMKTLMDGIAAKTSEQKEAVLNDYAQEKYNRVLANQSADKDETRIRMAKNLLIEANMLQAEADKKRNQAYEVAPELNPISNAPIRQQNIIEVQDVIPVSPISSGADDVRYNPDSIVDDYFFEESDDTRVDESIEGETPIVKKTRIRAKK